MTTEIITREQAEKTAIEFANDKLNNGFFVQKERKRDIFYVYYALSLSSVFKSKSFPFIDLVPGDACLVRGIDQKWVIKMFSRLRESGRPLFVSKIENIGNMTWGVTYDNYRKLGFNVLEIEEG